MFDNFGGVNFGSTLVRQSGSIGGARSVFVKLQGEKNHLVFPTFGGLLMNPFKGKAKIYAGDLMELRYDERGENPALYLLKTFRVAKVATNSATDIYIERDGYKHIPFVGDILMKEPDTFTTKGAGYAVTAVEATKDSGKDVWKITLATTLGEELAIGDVLVEAKESGAAVEMLVQNPNSVAPCDYDFFFQPYDPTTKEGARYMMTPSLGGVMYIHRMSPMPKVVLELNESRFNGWFKLTF